MKNFPTDAHVESETVWMQPTCEATAGSAMGQTATTLHTVPVNHIRAQGADTVYLGNST